MHAMGLIFVLGLAGCAGLHTPYVPPAVNVAPQWSQAAQASTAVSATTARATMDRWWTQFGDAGLDAVIEAALARNNDLAVAAFKVREARLNASLAEDNQRPALDFSASTEHQRTLKGTRATSRSSSAAVTVSYELDLWGRLSSLSTAAQWEAQATEQDRQSTAQALAGTAADLYWQLGYLNEIITTGEQSVAYAQRTLQLVQAQYAAGAVSALEVSEADKSVASQRAELAELQQQRIEARNSLAILFDAAPGTGFLEDVLSTEPTRLPQRPLPEVLAGLPAELLGRRPDLRAAELRLRETLADADATRASFYPALTLTGALGGASSALSNVLANPYALLGAGLTLPFLQANQMRLQTAIAQTEYERAVASFRQSLYTALADTETALAARVSLALRGEQLALALSSARRVERLYEVRYRNGYVALSVWLDAQESRRDAESQVAANQLSRLKNLSLLYRSLGGSV